MRASAVRKAGASKAEAHAHSRHGLDAAAKPVNPAWQALALRARAQRAIAPPDDPAGHEADHGVVARKTRVNAPMKSRPSSGMSALGFSHGGSPLARGTRETFETRFGADFSRVRIHDDAAAHESARNMNARAFTYGGNIAFADGQFRPETPSGQHLLAHELTHVVQQTGAHAPEVQRAFAMPPAGESQTADGPTGGPGAVLNAAARRFASFQTNASARLAALEGEHSTEKTRYLQSMASDQIARLGPLISQVQVIAAGTDTALQQKLVDQLSSGTLDRAEAWLNQVDRPAGASTHSVYSPLQSFGTASLTRAPAIHQRTAPAVARKSLEVSSPNDPAEIEADRVADAMMSGASPAHAIHSSSATVHRYALGGLELIDLEEAVEVELIEWEIEGLEPMIPDLLLLASLAPEAAFAAVDAAIGVVVAALAALPEAALIALIVALVIVLILILLLIIVLVLILVYLLVFADPVLPDDPDDPDDDEDCENPEDPLTVATARTIPTLLPLLDRTTYGSSTLTLLNGASATVGTNMLTEYLTKYKTGGKPPSGQDSIYGFTRLPQVRAHTDTKGSRKGYEQDQVYVKGHLLNHNVGGIGTSENLYPITGQANADHVNTVEDDVKEKVKDDGLVLSYNVVASPVAGPDWIDVNGDGTCTYQHLDADFMCTYATYRLCSGVRLEKNAPRTVPINSRFDETGFADNLKKPEKNCWEKDHPR